MASARFLHGIDHELLCDEVVADVNEVRNWFDGSAIYEVRLVGRANLWFPVRGSCQRPRVGDTVTAHFPTYRGVAYVVPLDAGGAAFAATDGGYFDRCQSRNPHDSPWAAEVRAASGALSMTNIRSRCTLSRGHAGDHIGPDDVTWLQE